jgi:hypothetical protein
MMNPRSWLFRRSFSDGNEQPDLCAPPWHLLEINTNPPRRTAKLGNTILSLNHITVAMDEWFAAPPKDSK